MDIFEGVIESLVSGAIVAILLEVRRRMFGSGATSTAGAAGPVQTSEPQGRSFGSMLLMSLIRLAFTPVLGFFLAAFYSGAMQAGLGPVRLIRVTFDYGSPLGIMMFAGFSVLAWMFLYSITSGRRLASAQLIKGIIAVVASAFVAGFVLGTLQSGAYQDYYAHDTVPTFILVTSMVALAGFWAFLNMIWPAWKNR